MMHAQSPGPHALSAGLEQSVRLAQFPPSVLGVGCCGSEARGTTQTRVVEDANGAVSATHCGGTAMPCPIRPNVELSSAAEDSPFAGVNPGVCGAGKHVMTSLETHGGIGVGLCGFPKPGRGSLGFIPHLNNALVTTNSNLWGTLPMSSPDESFGKTFNGFAGVLSGSGTRVSVGSCDNGVNAVPLQNVGELQPCSDSGTSSLPLAFAGLQHRQIQPQLEVHQPPLQTPQLRSVQNELQQQPVSVGCSTNFLTASTSRLPSLGPTSSQQSFSAQQPLPLSSSFVGSGVTVLDGATSGLLPPLSTGQTVLSATLPGAGLGGLPLPQATQMACLGDVDSSPGIFPGCTSPGLAARDSSSQLPASISVGNFSRGLQGYPPKGFAVKSTPLPPRPPPPPMKGPPPPLKAPPPPQPPMIGRMPMLPSAQSMVPLVAPTSFAMMPKEQSGILPPAPPLASPSPKTWQMIMPREMPSLSNPALVQANAAASVAAANAAASAAAAAREIEAKLKARENTPGSLGFQAWTSTEASQRPPLPVGMLRPSPARPASLSPAESSLLVSLIPNLAPPPSPTKPQITPLALVIDRIGSNSIVSTPYGRGVLKSLDRRQGCVDTGSCKGYVIIEMLTMGFLHVPVERAAEFEVVGKQQQHSKRRLSEADKRRAPESDRNDAPRVEETVACAETSSGGDHVGGDGGAGRLTTAADKVDRHSDKSPVKRSDSKEAAKAAVPASAELAEREVEADISDSDSEAAADSADANVATIARVDLPEEDLAIVGEWRHVERIITIRREPDCVVAIFDTFEAPLHLARQEDKLWHARKDRLSADSDKLYEVRFDGKNTLHLKKDTEAFFAHRVAQSKTLLGRWAHGGKSLVVTDEDGVLVLRTDGQVTMPLLRRGLMEWEARHLDGGDLVYLVEHFEGTDKISIRRPEGDPGGVVKGVEFVRTETDGFGHGAIAPATISSSVAGPGGGGANGSASGSAGRGGVVGSTTVTNGAWSSRRNRSPSIFQARRRDRSPPRRGGGRGYARRPPPRGRSRSWSRSRSGGRRMPARCRSRSRSRSRGPRSLSRRFSSCRSSLSESDCASGSSRGSNFGPGAAAKRRKRGDARKDRRAKEKEKDKSRGKKKKQKDKSKKEKSFKKDKKYKKSKR
eukprot:TRINITY_DN10551_c0_g1_i1.p1 TRINITY_DN10551_c0_g1~~TRINITY_DN10551_c0_g1_i1.p1  ORF type:complete len:1163 (-),score=189.68 TRINITY_DN10551_c0_g1_i1:265-3690(-)